MNRQLSTLPSLLAMCGTLVVEPVLFSQGQPAPTAQQSPNPAFAEMKEDGALPRVLLIGDSISIGYTLPTRSLLQGKANVHRIPVNGGPTINGLENLNQWLGTGKWDVIHFNWGLHDLRFMEDGKHQVAIDKYEKNLEELVRRLEQTGARLIWASTTPVPNAEVNPPRKSSDVIAYNLAAKRVMDNNRIPIDDLYAIVLPRLAELQRPANVHYTEGGYEFLAEHVAASIRRALDSRR
jgi:acyl-CoA thioesterase-1